MAAVDGQRLADFLLCLIIIYDCLAICMASLCVCEVQMLLIARKRCEYFSTHPQSTSANLVVYSMNIAFLIFRCFYPKANKKTDEGGGFKDLKR